MAKSLKHLRARKLRLRGESVKTIAKKLNISKSTASLWVRDIILTIEQLEILKHKSLKGAELGRLKSALIQKNKRKEIIKQNIEFGKNKFRHLTKRGFLIAGLALYWGEGSKKSQEVQFCNSDPNLINFMINWLNVSFGIKKTELRCQVGINQIHRKREGIILNYWVNITGLSITQFNKTSYKKTKTKKIFNNYDEYFGTLSVKVLKPSRFYYKIMGLIEGLSMAGSGLVSRSVS